MIPLFGVLALHDEGPDAHFGVDEAVFHKLLDDLAGGVPHHAELFLHLGEARHGVSRLVDAGFDAFPELIVDLFPDSTITLPDDLPAHLFDHGGEGSGLHPALAAHALSQQCVTWHDLACHSCDHGFFCAAHRCARTTADTAPAVTL